MSGGLRLIFSRVYEENTPEPPHKFRWPLTCIKTDKYFRREKEVKLFIIGLMLGSFSVLADDTHSILKKDDSRGVATASMQSGFSNYYIVGGIGDDERNLVQRLGGTIVEDPRKEVATKVVIPNSLVSGFESSMAILAEARANKKLGCAVKAALKCEAH